MERNLLTPMQEIMAGTLSNGNAFAELQRRRDDFNNNAQLPDDLRLRGKKIFNNALGIDLSEAKDRGIPIVVLLRNTMLTIGELYRENDSRPREPDTSSTSTLANKVRPTRSGHEQLTMPSMRDPAGAMQQASKSAPAGKYGHLSASNSQQAHEATASKDRGRDSVILSESDEDPGVSEAGSSSSDYDGKGTKRKRVAKQESIDTAIEGRNKKRRTHLASETPESDGGYRLYDVYENERAVGQSTAANSDGEELQSVQNTASRQPASAEKQSSYAVKRRIPKTQLTRPSPASQCARASYSPTAYQSKTTPQPPISRNAAATSQPATTPSPTTPPPTTSNHFSTHQHRASRIKTPPEVIYISSSHESSPDESQDAAYGYGTTPPRQSAPVPHTAAIGIKVEQQGQEGEQKEEQEDDHDQYQDREPQLEIEQRQEDDEDDQSEGYEPAVQDDQEEQESQDQELNASSRCKGIILPPFPPHTPRTRALFRRGVEDASDNIFNNWVLSPLPDATLLGVLDMLEAEKPAVVDAESKIVVEGAQWVYDFLRESCRDTEQQHHEEDEEGGDQPEGYDQEEQQDYQQESQNQDQDQELDPPSYHHKAFFSFPPLPATLTTRALTLFQRGTEDACEGIYIHYVASNPDNLTLHEAIDVAAETYITTKGTDDLESEMVMQGEQWAYNVLRDVCREQWEKCKQRKNVGHVLTDFDEWVLGQVWDRGGKVDEERRKNRVWD